MEPLRILLVDDHILFRKGVASLLNSQPDFEVVGEADDGYQALEQARELMPDLILMDIAMPRCDGRRATELIKGELPYVKIVMLTVSDDDQDLFDAIRGGAEGYLLLKKLEPEQLYDMLRGVSRGEAPISRLMTSRILREFRERTRPVTSSRQGKEGLTAREIEVLQLVADGRTNKEIAAALHIAENTVKNHLRNILEKLHLENRVQAAAYAVRQGLVRLSSEH